MRIPGTSGPRARCVVASPKKHYTYVPSRPLHMGKHRSKMIARVRVTWLPPTSTAPRLWGAPHMQTDLRRGPIGRAQGHCWGREIDSRVPSRPLHMGKHRCKMITRVRVTWLPPTSTAPNLWGALGWQTDLRRGPTGQARGIATLEDGPNFAICLE